MTPETVLCVNTGSSSVKLTLFSMRDSGEERLADGAVEGIGAEGRAWLVCGDKRVEELVRCERHRDAVAAAFRMLDAEPLPQPAIVGHRVVHGGGIYTEPARIDDALLASLRALVPLAPLHMPAAIAGIEAVRARSPTLPQVACFDTAFHETMPEIARRLPIPEPLHAAGVRRYGFHGISYEYVVGTLGSPPPPRVIVAHLGNGASVVAVKDGRSIDTTMAFTPTGGVLMGTRTGDLDPGVLVYLGRERGCSPTEIGHLVDHESGLFALGGTSDMRTLLARRANDERAALAVGMFAYSVRKAIGSYVASLGGVDLLVFTGGIGEHAAEVREEICRGLDAMGIALDPARNARGEGTVSAASSRCEVRVVRTDEELVVARHAVRLVTARPSQTSPRR